MDGLVQTPVEARPEEVVLEPEAEFPSFEFEDAGIALQQQEEEEDEAKASDPTKPLLSGSRGSGSGGDDMKDESKKATQEDEAKASEDNAKDLLDQIKSYLGIGEIAEDAEWFKLSYHDHEANRIEDRGELALSVEIVPWEEAENRKVGFGRDEPNTNPYLPPPMGRMQFSVNPFTMIKELLGPAVLYKILCCLCVILILVITLFLGTYLSGLVSIVKIFKGDI